MVVAAAVTGPNRPAEAVAEAVAVAVAVADQYLPVNLWG